LARRRPSRWGRSPCTIVTVSGVRVGVDTRRHGPIDGRTGSAMTVEAIDPPSRRADDDGRSHAPERTRTKSLRKHGSGSSTNKTDKRARRTGGDSRSTSTKGLPRATHPGRLPTSSQYMRRNCLVPLVPAGGLVGGLRCCPAIVRELVASTPRRAGSGKGVSIWPGVGGISAVRRPRRLPWTASRPQPSEQGSDQQRERGESRVPFCRCSVLVGSGVVVGVAVSSVWNDSNGVLGRRRRRWQSCG